MKPLILLGYIVGCVVLVLLTGGFHQHPSGWVITFAAGASGLVRWALRP